MPARTRKAVHTETETEDDSEWQHDIVKATTPKPEAVATGQKFGPGTEFKVRTIWTLIMLVGFFLIIALGHFYSMCLVFFLNVMIFKEILQLKRRREKEQHIPLFRVVNWYFFMVTCYYLYGRWLGSRLQTLALNYPAVEAISAHHNFKSFALYTLGFVAFVITLQKGFYRYQFRQFAWSHMTLLFVVCQSSVMIVNIFDGIFWFFLPAGLVITNDVFALIWGKVLTRNGQRKIFSRPLIKLSPNKTWEGFIGAFGTTLIFSVFLAWFFSLFEAIVCPQDTITVRPFSHPSCAPSYVFMPQNYAVPAAAVPFLGTSFTAKPVMFHSLAFGVFASIIAPFGGFFASGFKRAFKIKDFGDTIPGHGGITDRMDCQIIMSLFVYVYRSTFLARSAVTVVGVLSQVGSLSPDEQVALYRQLTEALTDRGLL